MELLQLQDNHHAFFIGGLVKEVHEGMAVNRVLNQRLLTCLSATESTCLIGSERRLLSAMNGPPSHRHGWPVKTELIHLDIADKCWLRPSADSWNSRRRAIAQELRPPSS